MRRELVADKVYESLKKTHNKMGIFDQIKAAQDMMKNMSPDQIKEMMEQAKQSQKMLEDMVQKAVEKAIKDRDLVSRDEVSRMIGK